jgi:dextranase
VEHDALLLAPGIIDVTGAYTGSYNDDCDVSFVAAPVSETADAGSVWRRVTQIGDRLVVHLVNLVGQTDALWDSARNTPVSPGPGTLRIRLPGPDLPRVRVADPDTSPRLIDVAVSREGDYAIAELPAPTIWQLILIDLVGEPETPLTETGRHR